MTDHWAADCAFLSRGWMVDSTVINKNRPVSFMKQETIGIIFNWDISTMHPLCPPQNIAWQYMVTYLMSPEIPKILAVLLL